MSMKRLDYFDTVKGIGIFLVVVTHSSFVADYVVTLLLSFIMPLFFIVSGMLIAYRDEASLSFKAMLRKKTKSIIIPYLCFSVCYTLIDIISVYLKQISLRDLKINLICTGSFAGSGPLWFLPALFLCELLFVTLLKHFGEKQALIICMVISIAGFILWYLFEPAYTASKDDLTSYFLLSYVFTILRSMVCLIFLTISYILFKLTAGFSKGIIFKNRILLPVFGIVIFAICAFLCRFNTNVDIHNMDYGNIALFLVNAFAASLGLILICRSLPSLKVLGIVRYWGKNSLLIMATHLNFYILYLGNVVAYKINPYVTHAKEYVLLFNILLVTMVTETALIYIVNRYIPWLVGKSK